MLHTPAMRPRLALPACLVALLACGPTQLLPSSSSPTPCPTFTVPKPAPPPPAAPLLGVYLPADRAASFTSCLDPDSPALRAIVKRARWKETEGVPAVALADDVRDLHAAMKKRYAGYAELAEHPTFDPDLYFAEWETLVRAQHETVTFEDGILRPLIGIRQVHPDNHLAPWGFGGRLTRRPELAVSEYQVHRTFTDGALAACVFGDAKPMPGTLRVARELGAHGLADIATFTSAGTADAIVASCGGGDVRFDRRVSTATGAKETDPVYEWRAAGDAAVIVVRRLWGPPEAEAKLRQLAADYDAQRAKKTIVFDFRGNGGGDDGYVSAWIEKAVRGTWKTPYVEVKVTGAELPCGDWNALVTDQISYDRVDLPDAKAERDAFWPKALAALKTATVVAADISDVTTNAAHPYAGRVFVLVDHASGSSGESGPDMLRSALGATIVGERTGGYLEYGNIRPWVMPRTGIVWGMASKRNYYPGPREAVGLPVPIYLPPDLLEKPVEELLPLLEALPSP
jgi:hypothetical protein